MDAGVKTLAMTYSGGDLFGQLGQEATTALAQKAGIDIVLSEAHDPAATDFTPLVTKVTDAKPDAFVTWGASSSS